MKSPVSAVSAPSSTSWAKKGVALLVLGFAVFGGIQTLPAARGLPACVPGWILVAQYDNSFQWQGTPTQFARWEGVVQLLQNVDATCTVLGIRITYTGLVAGGTLSLLGHLIGVSYSVQYPQPFDRYADVPINAWGDAVSWNPDGFYPGWYAHIHPDINPRGAEEYYVGTTHIGGYDPGLYQPMLMVITDISATFSLPLELRGQTVFAQLHVYPDLCRCIATPIWIP